MACGLHFTRRFWSTVTLQGAQTSKTIAIMKTATTTKTFCMPPTPLRPPMIMVRNVLDGALPWFVFFLFFLLQSPLCIRAQSSNPRVIAEIFECEEGSRRPLDVDSIPPRPVSHQFHFCIEPNLPTLTRGAVLRSIERFGVLKEGTDLSQLIIDDGGVVLDPDRTVVRCAAGSVTCTIQTVLRPAFFDSTLSNVTQVRAIAEVFFQRADRFEYIGRDSADVLLDLELTDDPEPAQPLIGSAGEEQTMWQEVPDWVRILIVISGAFVLMLMCCLVCMCLFGCLRKDGKGKAKKEEADDDAIVVILDPEPGSPSKRRPHKKARVLEATERVDEDETEDYYTNSRRDDDDEDEDDEEEDLDVYFDSEAQPGTRAFERALRKTVSKFGKSNYGPEVYRHLKKQLSGRRFMVYDFHDEDDEVEGEWREMQKKEVIMRFKKEFNDKKRSQEECSDGASEGTPSTGDDSGG